MIHQNNSIDMENKIWRSSPFTALILGTPWLLFFTFWLYDFITNSKLDFWFGAVVFFTGLLIIVWSISFRIEISNGNLIYSSLFGGKKIIPLDQIERVEYNVGIEKYTDRFLPFVRLSIIPRRGINVRAFHINLKVFRDEDVSEIINTISRLATGT